VIHRYLGLDLGGTNIKSVVLENGDDTAPTVVATDIAPTNAERGPVGVVRRIIEFGSEMIGRHGPIMAVGLGVPGLFDRDTGAIKLFPNLPGPWVGQPLREPVTKALRLPVAMINDARAFTLAEGTIGAGKGCHVIIGLTLGTGVGGGLMIGGKLHLGAWGVAGEVGHQTVVADGPLCGCGNRGCVEALTRADVLTALAGKVTVEEVYAAVSSGDQRSIKAVKTVAGYLGIGLANCVAVLGPDRIVIGGGIVAAGDLVLDPIRQAVRARVTFVPADEIEIVAAALGSSAGAIGAALAGFDSATPG
jgi:glucokinase